MSLNRHFGNAIWKVNGTNTHFHFALNMPWALEAVAECAYGHGHIEVGASRPTVQCQPDTLSLLWIIDKHISSWSSKWGYSLLSICLIPCRSYSYSWARCTFSSMTASPTNLKPHQRWRVGSSEAQVDSISSVWVPVWLFSPLFNAFPR